MGFSVDGIYTVNIKSGKV